MCVYALVSCVACLRWCVLSLRQTVHPAFELLSPLCAPLPPSSAPCLCSRSLLSFYLLHRSVRGCCALRGPAVFTLFAPPLATRRLPLPSSQSCLYSPLSV